MSMSSLELNNSEKQKPTIVMIDDNLDLLRILKKIIDMHLPGHKVLTVSDCSFGSSQGYQAIEIVNNLTSPTLFLVDYHLPGKNGLDLIEEMRNYALVPTEFVLVTGEYSEDVHIRARRMGVDTFYKYRQTGNGLVGKDYNFGELYIATIELAMGHLAKATNLIFDKKTNAYTVDGLAEQWIQVCNRMVRTNSSLERLWTACLFMDVNDFKLINDRFLNHEPGDLVLHEIGLAIHRVLRKTDLLGRMGDEFIAILLLAVKSLRADGTEKSSDEMRADAMAEAAEIGRRIKSEVEKVEVRIEPDVVLKTSISVGTELVAPWSYSKELLSSRDALLADFKRIQRKADSLTYADKLAHYERLVANGDESARAKYLYYKKKD